jgi:flagellum-specific peptidoglycan hydrolase FlgJ
MIALSPKQKAALALAVTAAHGAQLETGCPYRITVAQWGEESEFGDHAPGNNPFGIKAVSGYAQQMLETHEIVNGVSKPRFLAFTKFDSLQDAFEFHGRLLTRGAPYFAAFEQYKADSNLHAFILAVSAKYATAEKDPDPAKRYSTRLFEVLEMPDVIEALHV